ncbi:MAG: hypothetical protein JXD23_05595 [Spirochaetales bacterium]|nr:hypothetical protein [Spirochaetales bacterium]
MSGIASRLLRIASAVPAAAFSIMWWIILFHPEGGSMFGHPVAEVLSFVRAAWLAGMAFFGIANGIASWNSGKKRIRFAFLGMGAVFIVLLVLRLAGVA